MAPTLTARAIEPYFLTPRRHARPEDEQRAAALATRATFAHGKQHLTLYSWGAAERPVVLFVHGWEGRGTQVAAFLPALLEAGFRVVGYDAPGHGASPRALVSVVDFAAVVESAVRALGGSVHALLGHSVGGASAAIASGAAPAIATRVVAICPPLGPRDFLAQFTAALALSEVTRARLLARLDARYGRSFVGIDTRDSVRTSALPALIVHDRGDREVPYAHGEHIAAAWPKARFVATEGLGHRRILRDPEVVRAVVAFLAEPGAQTEAVTTGLGAAPQPA